MPLLKCQGMRTAIFKLIAWSERDNPRVSETALTESHVYANIVDPEVESSDNVSNIKDVGISQHA